MKRLNLLGYLLLIAVFFVSCEEDPIIPGEDPITQSQTLSDPNTKAKITPEGIKALGQQDHSTKQYKSSTIVLDFEGLGSLDNINNFYNGGTSSAGYSGTNYGVEFGVALSLIDADAGGSGRFENEPSPSTVMFFLDDNQAYMNVAAGFTTGLSFYYTSAANGAVSVYDGLNGTGNLLGTVNLIVNYGCTDDPFGYCNWDPIAVSFEGTAKSVIFAGAANNVGFDDVTFGSLTPGNSDSDGDGVLDDVDNCPLVPNPDQSDNDGDAIGDACDEDDDNDGILDVNDNCPFTANPGQEDYDGDGLGDVCDPDDDNDGVLDVDDSNNTSNMETTLTIGNCDTVVSNNLLDNGVTMADIIDELESGEYKNLGQEIKSYTELTNSWVAQGIITADQKTAIYSCLQ